MAPTLVHISEQSQLGLACFPIWKRELRWPGSVLFREGSQSPGVGGGGAVHLLSAKGRGRSAAPRAQALLGEGVVWGSSLLLVSLQLVLNQAPPQVLLEMRGLDLLRT